MRRAPASVDAQTPASCARSAASNVSSRMTTNLGVALLPRSLVPLRTPLRFVRLRGKVPRFNFTLVAPEHLELSAASRAFLQMVVEEGRG
jgi:DNA-binding transcriptional LysR family regulator